MPQQMARLIYVEGRGVLVDGVDGAFRVGDEVLLRAKIRGVEGANATPIKALLLNAGCDVISLGAPPPPSSWEFVTAAGDMRLAVPGGWIYQMPACGDNPGGVVFVPQHKEPAP